MVIFEKCESRAIKRDRDQCCKHIPTVNSALLPLQETTSTGVTDCMIKEK